MINGQEIPVILEKLWGTVNKVRDQLNENYLVKRMGQSRLFYGFFINMSESLGEAWFGLVMSTWKEFGTPLILQIREEWLANSLQDKRLKPKLEEIGFKAHEEFEFIYPLEITSPDCVGDVVLQIENVLAALMNNEVINNN